MAFGVKYRAEWKDEFDSNTHKVDIEIEGYVSSIITLRQTDSAFSLKYNKDKWISASEGTFAFIVNSTDLSAYDDDFYESVYKTVKVKHYVDGVLDWVGILAPEDTVREIYYPELVYEISANDGLRNLKKEGYEGFYFTGKQSLLQIIKNAISIIGIDDLDFHIQCGIYEDLLMTEDEQVFEVIEADNRRFYKNKNGELRPMKCYKVIEAVVKSFYCRFYQSGGFWHIVNGQEFEIVNESSYSSKGEEYDYDTLVAGTVTSGYGRVITLDSTYRRPGKDKWELDKQPPTKTLRVTFENMNLGGNEISNHDFSSGLTGWNNGSSPEDWYVFQVLDERLILIDPDPLGDPNAAKSFNSDTFFLEEGEGEGFIDWAIIMELENVEYDTGNYIDFPPYIDVRIHGPDGFVSSSGNLIIQEGIHEYINAPGSIPLVTGNYFIEVQYQPNTGADISVISLQIDEITASQSANGGIANTTFDEVFVDTPFIEAYEEDEETLLLADSKQSSDVGALFRGDDLTSSWSRYFAVINAVATSHILHLPFSGSATDTSAYGNTNITIDGVILIDDRDAVALSAYEFDNVPGDNIKIDHAIQYDIDYVSIFCWVKPYTDSAREQGVVSKTASFAFNLTNGNGLGFHYRLADGTTIYSVEFEGITIAYDAWASIGMSFNGSQLRLYINGSRIITLFLLNTGPLFHSSLGDIYIGDDNFRTGTPFEGGIDDVVMYNRALTDLDFLDLHANGVLTPDTTEGPEKVPLSYLFSQQYLNDHKAYYDKKNIRLLDINENIHYNDILSSEGKFYRFLNYDKGAVDQMIGAEIVQIDTTDIGFRRYPFILTSINGESTGSGANISVVLQRQQGILTPPSSDNSFAYAWADTESGSVKIGDVALHDVIVMEGVMKSGTTRIKIIATITHDGSIGEVSFQMTPYSALFDTTLTGVTISSIGEILLNYDVGALGASMVFKGTKQIL